MTGTMSWRGRVRRTWLGVLTLLGRPRGFFLPYRYAASLPAPASRRPYAALEVMLADEAPAFRKVLGWIDELAGDLAGLGGPPPEPRFEQDWFPRLDAAAAYALMRRLKPRRVVEIGAGHSTRFLARARVDGGFDCTITAIDPAPRADLAGLGVALHRCTLAARLAQAAPAQPAELAELGAGDFLLIDSSHLLVPGSDVDDLLGRVLPALPAGVLVQFHDIFLPDDYPAEWAWRGYNEQQGVLALLAGGGWRAVFASHYVATRMADAIAAGAAARLPLPAGARESAFWLRKEDGGRAP